jgi:predicted ATP-binding protein involved in virulence
MRFTRIQINKWRNFTEIELIVPKEATLVALIGENGVGKSSILDILNSASHHLGLSAGVDIPRGDPFQDEHDLRIDVVISREITTLLTEQEINHYNEQGITYDGCISIVTVKSPDRNERKIFLTNFEANPLASNFANEVVQALRTKEDIFHMSLDADRSYPPKPVQAHEYAQSLDQDWTDIQFKKNRAFVSSRNKYDEWMKFCVGTEAKNATESYQAQRLSKAKNTEPPEFVDQFSSYGVAIKNVLPHLNFLGVDTKAKTLIFDSTDQILTFDKLSGGEREIAFVVGQIERFELTNGVLLIDEPELHLNPEMVRSWVSYLRDSVKEGQTWIATHSMEAVESAGLECTFVVERDAETKKVNFVTSLVDQPVLSILSSAVGSPAFSLAKKAFVFIEGDRQGIERDKFYRLYGLLSSTSSVRFMEGGGCKEVERKYEACKFLAENADEQIHVGGIVDRDFRSQNEITELSNNGLYVLSFHEIENAFIYPPILQKVIASTGVEIDAHKLIQKASDKLAGKWILGRAKYLSNVSFDNQREINIYWAGMQWDDAIDGDVAPVPNCVQQGDIALFKQKIKESIDEYRRLRELDGLWMHCQGKQVLSVLPSELGFSRQIALINSVCSFLKDDQELTLQLFGEVENYVNGVMGV